MTTITAQDIANNKYNLFKESFDFMPVKRGLMITAIVISALALAASAVALAIIFMPASIVPATLATYAITPLLTFLGEITLLKIAIAAGTAIVSLVCLIVNSALLDSQTAMLEREMANNLLTAFDQANPADAEVAHHYLDKLGCLATDDMKTKVSQNPFALFANLKA